MRTKSHVVTVQTTEPSGNWNHRSFEVKALSEGEAHRHTMIWEFTDPFHFSGSLQHTAALLASDYTLKGTHRKFSARQRRASDAARNAFYASARKRDDAYWAARNREKPWE